MHAAIHIQRGACDKTGEIGREEQETAPDLLGHADAAHRNLGRETRILLADVLAAMPDVGEDADFARDPWDARG